MDISFDNAIQILYVSGYIVLYEHIYPSDFNSELDLQS